MLSKGNTSASRSAIVAISRIFDKWRCFNSLQSMLPNTKALKLFSLEQSLHAGNF